MNIDIIGWIFLNLVYLYVYNIWILFLPKYIYIYLYKFLLVQ